MPYIPNSQYINQVVDNFVNNVLADGGTVDEHLIRREYNDQHTTIKKLANLLVIGGASKLSTLYGIHPQTGAIYPFTYTRATTGTRVNTQGNIEVVANNFPRFDYDPVTLKYKGLLVERLGTNILLRSSEFNTAWTTVASTISADSVVSPSGSTDADALVEDGTASPRKVQQAINVTASTNYTFSCFVKAGAGSKRYVFLRVNDGATNANACSFVYDLQAKTIVGAATNYGTFTQAASVVTQYNNGWVRLALVFQSPVTGIFCKIEMSSTSSVSVDGQSLTYTGDSTSSIYLWGAQLETGQLTSYIPTTSAAVTRNADICTTPVTSWFNTASGTLYGQAQQLLDVTAPSRAVASIGANDTNRFTIYRQQGSRLLNTFVQPAGQAINGSTSSPNVPWKQAAAYNGLVVNSASLGNLNGNAVTTSLSPSTISTTTLNISNSYPGGVEQLDGWIRCIAYIPINLSNTDLQAITL